MTYLRIELMVGSAKSYPKRIEFSSAALDPYVPGRSRNPREERTPEEKAERTGA
jgi:hypothetical protein